MGFVLICGTGARDAARAAGAGGGGGEPAALDVASCDGGESGASGYRCRRPDAGSNHDQVMGPLVRGGPIGWRSTGLSCRWRTVCVPAAAAPAAFHLASTTVTSLAPTPRLPPGRSPLGRVGCVDVYRTLICMTTACQRVGQLRCFCFRTRGIVAPRRQSRRR